MQNLYHYDECVLSFPSTEFHITIEDNLDIISLEHKERKRVHKSMYQPNVEIMPEATMARPCTCLLCVDTDTCGKPRFIN